MDKKLISARIDAKLYMAISLAAAKEKISISQYLINLLEKAISNESKT